MRGASIGCLGIDTPRRPYTGTNEGEPRRRRDIKSTTGTKPAVGEIPGRLEARQARVPGITPGTRPPQGTTSSQAPTNIVPNVIRRLTWKVQSLLISAVHVQSSGSESKGSPCSSNRVSSSTLRRSYRLSPGLRPFAPTGGTPSGVLVDRRLAQRSRLE